MASPNIVEKKKSRHPRAKVACLMCRKRRVRCFVSSNGEPCSNCHLDSYPCIFQSPRRRKITHEDLLLDAQSDYIITKPLNKQYMAESPRDEYYSTTVNMHSSASDASSPASSCSTVTTITSKSDQRTPQDTSAWYAQPSSQLIGQKNAPGWFEVADLTDENEYEGREDQHYSLDNLIMDIPLFGE